MKNVLFSFLILFTVSSGFAARETRLLTDIERTAILDRIDSACADVWCEGDFNYSFDHIACNKYNGICQFEYKYIWEIWSDDDNIEKPIKSLAFPFICELKGFKTREDILDLKYPRFDYTSKFFWAVADCIEKNLPEAYAKIPKDSQ